MVMFSGQEFWSRLVERIREGVGALPRLPDLEEQMARLALAGRDVHEIAQRLRVSEETVWSFLQLLADQLTGRPAGGASHGFETGGLGSDTDPGVTGGYGDTGFGAIGNEPPIAIPEEDIEPHFEPPKD